PPPRDRQARCRHGDPPRLGGARRGPGAVRPDRGHVPRRDRRRGRRPHRRQERGRAADGARPRARRRPGGGHRVTAPTASASPARRIWSLIALPLVSILLALIVGAVLILASELLIPGKTFDPWLPLVAYQSLFVGAIGSVDAIETTLIFTTPLILAGLAVGLGFRAGLFNIGVLGQFLIGAVFACWFGVMLRDAPPIVAFPIALVMGIVGGALWGFIPGFLKARSGAHEVVTTIMLNYIAI